MCLGVRSDHEIVQDVKEPLFQDFSKDQKYVYNIPPEPNEVNVATYKPDGSIDFTKKSVVGLPQMKDAPVPGSVASREGESWDDFLKS